MSAGRAATAELKASEWFLFHSRVADSGGTNRKGFGEVALPGSGTYSLRFAMRSANAGEGCMRRV